MPIVDGVKWACDNCIRGHRVSHCTHDERPLNQVAKKGRPVTQCTECRKKRKEKKTRTKCQCGKMTVRCPHVAQPGEHLENHENFCCCNHGEECTCCAKASGVTLDKIPASVPEDGSESSDYLNFAGSNNMTGDMEIDVTPDTWSELGPDPFSTASTVAADNTAALAKSRAAVKPRPRPARAPPRSNTIHSSDPARQMQAAGVSSRQQRAPQRGGTRRNMRRTNSTPGIGGFPMSLHALATSEGFNFDQVQADMSSAYSYGTWDQMSPQQATWDQANIFGTQSSANQTPMMAGFTDASTTNQSSGAFDQWREAHSVAQSGAASPTMDDARSVVSGSIDHTLAAHTNPFSQQWVEQTQAFQEGFGSLNLASSTQPPSLLPSVEPSPMLGAMRNPSTPPLLTLASGVDTGFNTPSSELNSLGMTGAFDGLMMPSEDWSVYETQPYDASSDANAMTQSFNDDYSVRNDQGSVNQVSSSYQTEPQSVSSTSTLDGSEPTVPQLTNSALTSGNVSEAEGEFDGLSTEAWNQVYQGATLGDVTTSLKDDSVVNSVPVSTEYTDHADAVWDDNWLYAPT